MAGLDEAVDRANAALAVGADAAFVEAPLTEAEIAAVPGAVNGPCLYNAVPGGRSPAISLADLDAFGYRIVIFPTALLGAVVAACDRALTELAAAGAATAPSLAPLATDPGDGPAALFRQVGAEEWDRLRERYDHG